MRGTAKSGMTGSAVLVLAGRAYKTFDPVAGQHIHGYLISVNDRWFQIHKTIAPAAHRREIS